MLESCKKWRIELIKKGIKYLKCKFWNEKIYWIERRLLTSKQKEKKKW